MVVIPGLSESLVAVGERIIRFDTTDTLPFGGGGQLGTMGAVQ
jgi:hypothetical protein